ncbi:SUMF1/EgtB/PvdO family nonheme iron enzyme [Histidinibacterium aquaticum]|uniref:Formylglycine-generating enzyme family protein n=1 Tax=Histidinibacterium aquaticum TaxID=2613962 RepID=A0A5J5GRA0_9RHOB|nr:SUMF1/EgtB/PvdO family nonheme iron enzyme [Histidinibacterium aquaticum]KAA9010078.1 formylglycine-generating enzyme family protein [Histidinibacterium aquaticum]
MKLASALLLSAALGAVGLGGWEATRTDAFTVRPETVVVPPGSYDWRPSGDWLKDGKPVDPPLIRRDADAPLEIMTYQVSRGDYSACVAARACPETGTDLAQADLPMVQANLSDATAYADWLSDETGETWRLPTDEEWQRAAAERFVDDATIGGDYDTYDPGRWLNAAYARNTKGRWDSVQPVRPPGAFGFNSHGIADLGGNVWEWTTTCQSSGVVSDEGEMTVRTENCIARIVAGQHRALIVDFVRDARAGGCGAGIPPDHLGFRLVRDTPA